ncbi:hypothetical protein ABCR94_25740 [Streptomyces sp. 21So2-11]|uniref:hypothetical protein n=1 Tax=Streptomyces sp. 21So2-11 TaxID=3144408 RepID=UPI0032193615
MPKASAGGISEPRFPYMVSSSHEASHRIFQDRPELLTPVFRILGVPLSDKPSVEVLTPDATEIRPLERRVDSVLRVHPPGEDRFLLAIEAQGRRDPDKASSWTYYLAYLQAKYDMPALLLVVCQDELTAEWAAGPFRVGVKGWTALSTHPLVLGPNNVPRITDPAEAALDLPLATFSAMTHGKDPNVTAILKALVTALGRSKTRSIRYYAEMLEIGLGATPARDIWRNLMNEASYFPGRGTLVEETYLRGEADGEAKGKAEGKADSILQLLAARSVPVSDAAAQRITDCTDLNTLNRWFGRAVTAEAAEELFTEADQAESTE